MKSVNKNMIQKTEGKTKQRSTSYRSKRYKTASKRKRPVRFDKKTSPSGLHSRPSARRGESKLKIIVLGGNEEVGRNMTVLEYGHDIIIIDLGLQFPEEDMPGIDYIIPNIEYLKGKQKNIRGIFVTHGHYDHIGAIPHVMADLGNPIIYSSDLTLAMIAKRQEDYKNGTKLNLQSIKTNDVIKAGCFTLKFFGVSHNIPASMGLIIDTPVGKIVHTGDLKLDLNESGDTATEIDKISALGKQNVLALLSDSTNAAQPGHQLSESEIQHNLDNILKERGDIK